MKKQKRKSETESIGAKYTEAEKSENSSEGEQGSPIKKQNKGNSNNVQRFISDIRKMEKRKTSKNLEHEIKKNEKTESDAAQETEIKEDDPEHSNEDPEKAAIREKKRQKRHEKKEAKKQELEAAEAAKGTAPALALEYLQKWDTDHDNWSFQKVRQVWLLQNMYDTEKISEESFPILLRYLEGLKGRSREITVEKAEKLLEAADNQATENEGSSLNKDGYERIRQVIQLLS